MESGGKALVSAVSFPPIQSEITPENTLATEAVASAIPSISPTESAPAPSTVTRNTGSRP